MSNENLARGQDSKDGYDGPYLFHGRLKKWSTPGEPRPAREGDDRTQSPVRQVSRLPEKTIHIPYTPPNKR